MRTNILKKAIFQIFLFVVLIPLGAALVFTGIGCLFSNQYYEWYWVPEWLCVLPEVLAHYIVLLSVFAALGVTAYFVFFEKPGKAVLLSLAFLVAAFVSPLLRYVVRHLCFLSTMTAADMLDYYETDVETALYLVMYMGIAFLVLWLERAFYKWILKETPERTSKMISPKNPVGLAMLIFFAALAALSTLLFVLDADYTLENFLALGIEYVIDFAGFMLAVFSASRTAKRMDSVRLSGSAEKQKEV